MIKAIPWTIDGIPFRSKLEAKWYLVFKMLFPGCEIEYEPQAFELSDVSGDHFDNYLPDFLIKGKYIEIKPLLETYEARDQQSIWNAMVLGYSNPTVLILGYPKEFYAVECTERRKGCPEGFYLDANLRRAGNWDLDGCYPDEHTLPSEFPLSDFLKAINEFPAWREVEKKIQWKPKAKK